MRRERGPAAIRGRGGGALGRRAAGRAEPDGRAALGFARVIRLADNSESEAFEVLVYALDGHLTPPAGPLRARSRMPCYSPRSRAQPRTRAVRSDSSSSRSSCHTTGCCASSLAAVDLRPRSDGSKWLRNASVQGAIAGGCVSSARSYHAYRRMT
jgi:hypothetical protein